jgi:hypothetical protein
MRRRGRGGAAGIVATIRTPGRAMLADWLAYHRAVGVVHFLLYFDDPNDTDREVAEGGKDVTVVVRDETLVAAHRALPQWASVGAASLATDGTNRLIARQILNVAHALERAPALGLDWLLHIDHDELFLVPGDDARAHFAALSARGVEHAVYLNHEAVPETVEVDDVFREVTLFKRNPDVLAADGDRRAADAAGRRFVAYARGKAAIRVGSGALARTAHAFARPDGAPLATVALAEPCVLHYPSCGFARWRAKYEQLGDFGDTWLSGQPIRLPFHLASRDLRRAPEATARAYFRRTAMLGGAAAREKLLARGVLVRVRRPARLLARLTASPARGSRSARRPTAGRGARAASPSARARARG